MSERNVLPPKEKMSLWTLMFWTDSSCGWCGAPYHNEDECETAKRYESQRIHDEEIRRAIEEAEDDLEGKTLHGCGHHHRHLDFHDCGTRNHVQDVSMKEAKDG